MPSEERKGKEKQKLLQKSSQNYLSNKVIFQRNEPPTNFHKDTYSLDLQNNLQVSLEVIQPEETSNYEQPVNGPNENN